MGDLDFQLEESAAANQKAAFNLRLFDHSDEDIERIKALGYKCDYEISIYGRASIRFRPPDGGKCVNAMTSPYRGLVSAIHHLRR